MSLRVAALALAVLAAVPSYAGPARAQGSESASLVGAARELYREGVRAGGEERWEDARSAFERSYELAPRVATLLNLAVALEHLGRFVEAIDAYRRFLARADEATLRERGEAAHAAISALEGRLARVSITVRGIERGDVVTLDGTPLEGAALGLDLPVDPGAHVVGVARGERACGETSVELGEGARRDVELVATCPTLPADALVIPEPEPADDTPWIVLGVVGGVAVVAAIVVGVVVATTPSEPLPPYVGNVGRGTFILP